MIASRQWRRRTQQILPALLLAALPACSLFQTRAKLGEPVALLAVMPIERDPSAGPVAGGGSGLSAGAGALAAPADAKPTGHDELTGNPAREAHGIAPGAERVVTAQIYEVLSSSPHWRFVPDLTVTQALIKADASGDEAVRARALGTKVNADAVLFGTVSRYVERIGAEYGAKQPAAVGIRLQLISVKTGVILWTDAFDQEQQPLSSNLLNWWQFWQGGPKWFSAPEFAHLAVERLLDDLAQRME